MYRIISILILIFLLNSNVCFGNEALTINLGDDYLIMTKTSINANAVSNPEIITLTPFFTIFNEKNVFLLHPQKEGKSNLVFFFNNESKTFEITVNTKKSKPTFITNAYGDFEFILLDAPPNLEEIEIDAPPIKNQKSKDIKDIKEGL